MTNSRAMRPASRASATRRPSARRSSSAYELADTIDDEDERARAMTFVLVGAGPTGVELAASLAQMATLTLRGQFRNIDAAESVIILDRGRRANSSDIFRGLGAEGGAKAREARRQDHDRRQGRKVDEQGVVANGKRIPSATVMWTAGVAPSPLVKQLGGKTDKAGRAAGWTVHGRRRRRRRVRRRRRLLGQLQRAARARASRKRRSSRDAMSDAQSRAGSTGVNRNVRSDIQTRAIWRSSARISRFWRAGAFA